MSSPDVTAPVSRAAPVRRRCVAIAVAAAALLVASAGHGDAGQAAAAGATPGAPQVNASVDPRTESCSALKSKLNAAGEMSILSGPRGAWGDTFYGPAVPRCQFWQMPVFTYVKARDGLCGVGYICVEKLTFD